MKKRNIICFIEPADDGVLGGYGALTPVDVVGSNSMLDELSEMRPTLQFDRAGAVLLLST